MTDTADRTTTSGDPVAEVKDWLADNWDPDLTVAEWWERLGTSGWAVPTWPSAWFGKDLSRAEGVRVQQAIADFGALPAPGGLGLMLAGPTIAVHGDRRAEDSATCATSSPASGPGASSSASRAPAPTWPASTPRAVKDGEEWIVNGQKVWTSGGHVADLGMLIARTDPDQPKHAGITYFVIDMHQPGVEVVPLREMTGRALFNEVFLTDARVGDDTHHRRLNNGWRVANTTLMFERTSLGAGGGSAAASLASPGQVAGDLDKRAGDFVASGGRRGGGGGTLFGASAKGLIELAKGNGKADDPADPPEAHAAAHHRRGGPVQQPAAQGGDAGGQGHPRPAQHLQAADEQHGAPVTRRRPRDRRRLRHAARLRRRATARRSTRPPASPSCRASPRWRCSPRARRSTAAPTRCSATSSASGCSGLPKEPGFDKSTPFKDLPKNG